MQYIENDKTRYDTSIDTFLKLYKLANKSEREPVLRKIRQESVNRDIHFALASNRKTPSDVLTLLAIEYYKKEDTDILYRIFSHENCEKELNVQLYNHLSTLNSFEEDKWMLKFGKRM